MKRKSVLLISIIFCYSFNYALSQNRIYSDTIKLSITEAENQFISKNLLLLAEKCNIDVSKASIIQAKLWDNPNVSFEQNMYNFSTKKFFDFSSTGNTSFEISQLFLLAGKRNKKVGLEKINLQKAEYTFYELLRNLKFELRVTFFDINYLIQTIKIYNQEINSLSKVIDVYEKQYSKGNISLMETTRLKAFLFSLTSEENELAVQLIEKQANLNLLTGNSNAFLIPLVDKSITNKSKIEDCNLQDLIDTAFQNRFDLKIEEANVDFANSNLLYQKSLVPDLNVDIQAWNRAGSYVRDYNAITLQFSLPLWNRNQGNIKIAKSQILNSTYNLEYYRETVKSDVIKAFSKAIQIDQIYKSQNKSFSDSFEKLSAEILSNYQDRNISLLEFIDFYDSYKNFVLQYNKIENNRASCFEELNYSVGKNIINN